MLSVVHPLPDFQSLDCLIAYPQAPLSQGEWFESRACWCFQCCGLTCWCLVTALQFYRWGSPSSRTLNGYIDSSWKTCMRTRGFLWASFCLLHSFTFGYFIFIHSSVNIHSTPTVGQACWSHGELMETLRIIHHQLAKHGKRKSRQ